MGYRHTGEPVPLGQFESDLAMPRLPPLDPASALMTGYNDCGEEAIRYLMEVENLPADHPLVVGLRSHLIEQRKALDLANLISGPPLFGSGPNYSSPSEGQTDSSYQHLPTSEFLIPGSHSVVTVPDSAVYQDFVPLHGALPSMSETDLLIRSLAEEIFSLLEEDDGFYDEDDEVEEDMSYSHVGNSLQATEQ
ncbi:uncharacterized protein LOC121372543 isoform X2 [Gigantopelta aegis]|nr:uncharacterized protein LOC121372543 isoform X2 [Gigantopelta aegis]